MLNLMSLLNTVQSWLSGKKTYAVGLAMCLSGIAGILNEVAGMHGIMDLVALVQNGASDPGMVMLLQGFALLAGRHAIAKMTPPAPPAA